MTPTRSRQRPQRSNRRAFRRPKPTGVSNTHTKTNTDAHTNAQTDPDSNSEADTDAHTNSRTDTLELTSRGVSSLATTCSPALIRSTTPTRADKVPAGLNTMQGCSARIIDTNQRVVTGLVGTGCQVQLIHNGAVVKSYTVILLW